MAAPISKRQQARNERQLQELIHTQPGNDRCADCAAQNPGWASWNLGIFLCVRCASLHRKLGTHVSKVKSLSMDAWSTEQVENMKKLGNARSNAIYNPQHVRPDVPIDADEVDAAVERFIRQKYESRALSTNRPAARQNTGSTGSASWSEDPPPLPPKPKKFFSSLRSASSTVHRPKQDRAAAPLSPDSATNGRSPSDAAKASISKPSQMFGMRITSVSNNFDQKLATLRDMGFSDNRRNSEILKSSNGNLDKAVETLVRLGEGSRPSPLGSISAARSLTPVSRIDIADDADQSEQERPPATTASNNPWAIKESLPQRSVSQPVPQSLAPPRSQSAGPSPNNWNPFATEPAPTQNVQSLGSDFQALQVSQTGPSPQQQQFSGLQIPQVPQIPEQYQSNTFPIQQAPFHPWQTPQQQTLQQAQPATAPMPQPPVFQQQAASVSHSSQPGNPFLPSYSSPPSNPWAQPSSAYPSSLASQSNPWAQQSLSPVPMAQPSSSPFVSSSAAAPWVPQQYAFPERATASPSPIVVGQQADLANHQPQPSPAANPWQQAMAPQQPYGQQQYPQIPQQPPVQPIRHDKNSILALYNLPDYRQPLQTLQEDPNAVAQTAVPQRSVTMPVQYSSSNVNPFPTVAPPNTQTVGHVSNESRDFVNLGGRQSPDAFAGLSAQYMR